MDDLCPGFLGGVLLTCTRLIFRELRIETSDTRARKGKLGEMLLTLDRSFFIGIGS